MTWTTSSISNIALSAGIDVNSSVTPLGVIYDRVNNIFVASLTEQEVLSVGGSWPTVFICTSTDGITWSSGKIFNILTPISGSNQKQGTSCIATLFGRSQLIAFATKNISGVTTGLTAIPCEMRIDFASDDPEARTGVMSQDFGVQTSADGGVSWRFVSIKKYDFVQKYDFVPSPFNRFQGVTTDYPGLLTGTNDALIYIMSGTDGNPGTQTIRPPSVSRFFKSADGADTWTQTFSLTWPGSIAQVQSINVGAVSIPTS
jgi:hypothetical protein